MIDDPVRCYRALLSRDARFDGVFYVAVTSTRIYCRPSCPARTPHERNCRFYPSAAAAQQSGFRACKRCRPDAVPGSPEWHWRGDVVGRALRLIGDGVIDREGVGGVARRVGYSERQLERLLNAEVGAGPLAIARAQRARTARVLLESTPMRAADVAFAAGFASVRQFNDTMREVFAASPTELRVRANGHVPADMSAITLRLAARAPFAAPELLAFLGARAIAGVETWDGATYARVLSLPSGPATVEITTDGAETRALVATLRLEQLRDLAAAVARLRNLGDLDADPVAVDEHLGRDPRLRAAVRARPGLRVPGTVDGNELAVRAVLGQQVSVAGARTLAARVVPRAGTALPAPHAGLTHTFPTAAALAGADLDGLGLTGGRVRSLHMLARELASGALVLDPGADREATRRALVALPGIGPWTAEYIAMRALADPDAFPVTDLGVGAGAGHVGLDGAPRALAAHAERWRPWRAYAALHLWSVPSPSRPSISPKKERSR